MFMKEKSMNKIIEKEIKWHPKTNRISQIPKEGLEFAMLSPKYEQLNQLVWCKDFMQDLIWSYLNNQTIDIYGFKYDPHTSPAPSLSKLRLIISNYKDKEFEEKIINGVIPLVNSIEDRLKMQRTFLEKSKNHPAIYKKSGIWILNASKRWLKAAPMLSFYTLLIRIGLVHNKEDSFETTIKKIKNNELFTYYDVHGRDKDMIIKAYEGIEKILKYTDRFFFSSKIRENYSNKYLNEKNIKSISIYNIHDRCGIVGFSCGTTKQYFPQWHKKER